MFHVVLARVCRSSDLALPLAHTSSPLLTKHWSFARGKIMWLSSPEHSSCLVIHGVLCSRRERMVLGGSEWEEKGGGGGGSCGEAGWMDLCKCSRSRGFFCFGLFCLFFFFGGYFKLCVCPYVCVSVFIFVCVCVCVAARGIWPLPVHTDSGGGPA